MPKEISEVRQNIQSALSQRLEPYQVKLRSGPGNKSLSYIETHSAISEANKIFWYDGWSTQIIEITQDYLAESNNKWTGVFTCQMRITLSDGSFRTDAGVGTHTSFSVADVIEKAKKEAVSDAIKRCLRQFGDRLGNCLYNDEARKGIEMERKEKKSKASIVQLNPVTPPTPESPPIESAPVVVPIVPPVRKVPPPPPRPAQIK